MTVMTRIIRLWKADFNGLMDELEDKNLLIKQHIREMEEELEKKKKIIEEIELEKEELLQEHNNHLLELKDLEKDLKVAILKEKDDISRMLIKKITIINRQRKDLEQHRLVLEQKSQKLIEKIKEQQAQYNLLKLKAREYLTKEERSRNVSFQNDPSFYAADTEHEPSSEEIELELLKYKEGFKRLIRGKNHETRQ